MRMSILDWTEWRFDHLRLPVKFPSWGQRSQARTVTVARAKAMMLEICMVDGRVDEYSVEG